jgi:hypothetical protein
LGSVHPAEPDGAAALAAKLDDYLALAAAHRHGLGRVPGFEESLLDEARELSGELKRRGPAGERTVEARTLFLRRNRLATLLFLKLSRVRTLNPDTSGP